MAERCRIGYPLAAVHGNNNPAVTIEYEVKALREYLDQLARDEDDELISRYELKRPPMPPGLYWRLRWIAGWILRSLRPLLVWRPDPWPVVLKQAYRARMRPVLIWAIGVDRGTLRAACDGFARMQDSPLRLAPVLVTDVADFAFFSRLGWLVEYVPKLAGEGPSYDERKARLLARLYRRLPALPVAVGLAEKCPTKYLRR